MSKYQLVLADKDPRIRSKIQDLTKDIVINLEILDSSRFSSHINEISDLVSCQLASSLSLESVELHGAPRDIFEIRKFLACKNFRKTFTPISVGRENVYHLEPRLTGDIDLSDGCHSVFAIEGSLSGVARGNEPFPRITDYLPRGETPRIQAITIERELWFRGITSQSSQANARRRFDASGVSIDEDHVRFDADSIRKEYVWSEAYNSPYPTALMETAILIDKYREAADHFPSTTTFTCLLAKSQDYDVILSPIFQNDFFIDEHGVPRSHTIRDLIDTNVLEGITLMLPSSRGFKQYRTNGQLRGRGRLGMPYRTASEDDEVHGYGELMIEKVAVPHLSFTSDGKSFVNFVTDRVPQLCSRSFGALVGEAKELILRNEWLRCRNINHALLHSI